MAGEGANLDEVREETDKQSAIDKALSFLAAIHEYDAIKGGENPPSILENNPHAAALIQFAKGLEDEDLAFEDVDHTTPGKLILKYPSGDVEINGEIYAAIFWLENKDKAQTSVKKTTAGKTAKLATEVVKDITKPAQTSTPAVKVSPPGVKPDANKPPEKEEEKGATPLKGVPNNQFGKLAAETQKFIDDHPNANGPLSRGILSILVFLAKNVGYFDLMPGHFYDQLDEDKATKDLVLSKEEKEALLAFRKDRKKPTLTEEEKQNLNAENAEAISATYAARWLLGGETKITEANALGAALKHTTKMVNGEAVPYYRGLGKNGKKISLAELKTGMPAGTVLIFIPNPKKPSKLVGIATGNETEFEYMDATGTLQTVRLTDFNQTAIKSEANLTAAFMPQFKDIDEGYFAKHPELIDTRFDPLKAKIKEADLIGSGTLERVDKMLDFETKETTKGEIFATRAGKSLEIVQKALGKIDLIAEDLKKQGAFKPSDFVNPYKQLIDSLVKVRANLDEANKRVGNELEALEKDKELKDKDKAKVELNSLLAEIVANNKTVADLNKKLEEKTKVATEELVEKK